MNKKVLKKPASKLKKPAAKRPASARPADSDAEPPGERPDPESVMLHAIIITIKLLNITCFYPNEDSSRITTTTQDSFNIDIIYIIYNILFNIFLQYIKTIHSNAQ